MSREERLAITLTKEEKDEIQKKADEMGVTMSGFARIVIKDFMKKGEN